MTDYPPPDFIVSDKTKYPEPTAQALINFYQTGVFDTKNASIWLALFRRNAIFRDKKYNGLLHITEVGIRHAIDLIKLVKEKG